LFVKVILFISLVIFLVVFTVLEFGLRILWGFGKPLLYIADEQIGYVLAPNQNTKRFGNRIQINEYGMRSSTIQLSASPKNLRILLLGDSIANGGWWTDQDKTISSLMMKSLSSKGNNNSQVEVLNASANSWGPRNELAYLKRFGFFKSQILILLINTDDLFATAPSPLKVGRDKNYPAQKPPLALAEVLQRYLVKDKPIPELKKLEQEAGDRVGINLQAISKIQAIALENNCQFLLAMTPLLREVGAPGPRDYELKARQRLLEFTEVKKIKYIDLLPVLNSAEKPQNKLYQDHIHFNFQGNQLISQIIEEEVLNLLSNINEKVEIS
jgi:GDSL-like Lipase/Acylhydrolase family